MGLCTSLSAEQHASTSHNATSAIDKNSFEAIYKAFPILTLNDILENDHLFFPEIDGVMKPVEEHKRVVLITGRAMVDPENHHKYAILCSSVLNEACVHYESIVYETEVKKTSSSTTNMTKKTIGWQAVGEDAKYCPYYLVDPKNPSMKLEIIGHRTITSQAVDFVDPIDSVTGMRIDPTIVNDLMTQRLNAIQHSFIKKHMDLLELEPIVSGNSKTVSTTMGATTTSITTPRNYDSKSCSTNSTISLGSKSSSFGGNHYQRNGSSKRCYQAKKAFKLSEKFICLGEQICILGVLNKRHTDVNAPDNGDNTMQYFLSPISGNTISMDMMKRHRHKWTMEQKKIWFDYFKNNNHSMMFITNSLPIVKLRPIQKIAFDPSVKISKRISSTVNKEIVYKRQQQLLRQQSHDVTRVATMMIRKQYSGSTSSASTNVSMTAAHECNVDSSEPRLPNNGKENSNEVSICLADTTNCL